MLMPVGAGEAAAGVAARVAFLFGAAGAVRSETGRGGRRARRVCAWAINGSAAVSVVRTIVRNSKVTTFPVSRLTRKHLRAFKLLVYAPIVFEPSRLVTTVWVMVCPVNRSTLLVPFIFAEEFYLVANLERVDSRCQINIVRD